MSDETTNPLRDEIRKAIDENPVLLFMKGTPEQPMCGFSARTVGALQALEAPFAAVDVLPDPRIRQELSALSNWPTIPQLFVDGELVGGCDIVTEMFESGELAEALGVEQPEERAAPGAAAGSARRSRSRTGSAEEVRAEAARPRPAVAAGACRRTTLTSSEAWPEIRMAGSRYACRCSSYEAMPADAVVARHRRDALISDFDVCAPRRRSEPAEERETAPDEILRRAAGDVERVPSKTSGARPSTVSRGIGSLKWIVRSGPRSTRTRSATGSGCRRAPCSGLRADDRCELQPARDLDADRDALGTCSVAKCAA